MIVSYYKDNFDNSSNNYLSGLRRILHFESVDKDLFKEVLEKYDFYEVCCSDLIRKGNKKGQLRYKSEFNYYKTTSILGEYNIDELELLFYLGLRKVNIDFDANMTRMLGFKKGYAIDKNLIDFLAEKAVELGVQNSYDVLNPNDLSQTEAKVFLIKRYLGNENFILHELIHNELNDFIAITT